MSNNIIFEVIKHGRMNYAVPKVFVNEDGFPQNSRCSECNRFNRRLSKPDTVKTTIGKDGRTYVTPIVSSCTKHEDVQKRDRKPKSKFDWKIWREDYYIRIEVKQMKPARTRRGQQPTKKASRPMVPHYSFYWVRQDLVTQFIANPPFVLGNGSATYAPRSVIPTL